MTWVWNCSKSKNAARLVLLAIADAAGVDGRAFPSIKELQYKANLQSERSVQAALKALVRLRELDIKYNQGEGGCNLYKVRWDPAESAGAHIRKKLQVKPRTPAKSAPPQNLRGPAKSAGGTPTGDADQASPQATPGTPAKSAPRNICAPPQNLRPEPIGREELPPPSLPTPLDGGEDAPGREEGDAKTEHQIAEFISGLPLKKALRNSERDRLAELIAAKRAGGWMAKELRKAITDDLATANSPIAVILTRLKDLPDSPPRRPQRAATTDTTVAEALARTEAALEPPLTDVENGLAQLRQAIRPKRGAPDAETTRDADYLAARRIVDAAPKADRDAALAQAAEELSGAGIVERRARVRRAAELLERWNAREPAAAPAPADHED